MSTSQKRSLKRGRAPLGADLKKSGKIDVRVNVEDRVELERRAQLARMYLSTFMRTAALGCVIEAPPPLQNIEAYRSLVKVGNLLNQAIREVHSGQIRNIDWEILSDLKRDVKALALDLIGAKQ